MDQNNIRNFVIISHIDHGKSTLADRFLELTGTVDKRELRDQFLDQMDLEREKGITIKMQPVRMLWHSDRGKTQNATQNDVENGLLYEDITYKIRGAAFEIRKRLGLGHKESIYSNALEQEFSKKGLQFETEKSVSIFYDGKKVGSYQPDFIIEDKIIIELKALPELGRPQTEQLWSYLKGSDYKLALLINFGSKDLEIKRVVYDSGRFPRPSASLQRDSAQVEYVLNLIDTPGHADFSYEVSRALAAVEGAILLVDGTQGVQAQTLAHLELAKREGLTIIGAVNKIDLPIPDLPALKNELAGLIGVPEPDIFEISAKTGANVPELLRAVVERIPAPSGDRSGVFRALIFDSVYDIFQGAIAYVRVKDGAVLRQQSIQLLASGFHTKTYEVGVFRPQRVSSSELAAGEIGYIITGIKEPGAVRVGDTIAATSAAKIDPLPGYDEPQPMVFAGFYPRDARELPALKDALAKLKLNDAALMFEPDRREELGQGFRLGFLGALHLEIVKERLRREYGIDSFITMPSVRYKVRLDDGKTADVFTPADLPETPLVKEVQEPWIVLEVFTPQEYMQAVSQLVQQSRGRCESFETLSRSRIKIHAEMPLAEMILDFHDKLKSVSRGFASMHYRLLDWRKGDLARLDILIMGESNPALARILAAGDAERIGRKIIEKLKEILPREVFPVPIQAAVGSRILARVTVPALKKNVTGHLYGGDRTRKMKLWEKQKRGKERLAEGGRVRVPASAFFEILKINR